MPTIRYQDEVAKANAAMDANDPEEVLRIGQKFLEAVIGDAIAEIKKPRSNPRLAVKTANDRWRAFANRVKGEPFKPNAFKDFFLKEFASETPEVRALAASYFSK